MTSRSSPQQRAKEFAATLQNLLTRTVAHHVRLNCVADPRVDRRFIVANGVSTRNLETRPIRLETGSEEAYCWLDLIVSLFVDHRGYLTVFNSSYQVLTGRDGDRELFRFDYERAKGTYPEAHLQVCGKNSDLGELMSALGRPKRELHKLHLPVGGRRYRPALEDVLEFLIREGIVTPHDGWQQPLTESRDLFQEHQLKAAVWRRPEVVRDALRAYDDWRRRSENTVVPHERTRSRR